MMTVSKAELILGPAVAANERRAMEAGRTRKLLVALLVVAAILALG